jgi:UrcA family protein
MNHPEGDCHVDINTQRAIRSFSSLVSIRVALVALFALTSAVALADPRPANKIAKVSLAGLDLSTPQGARVAYERIKTVAERLCSQVENDPFREIYVRCARETLTDAIRKLNAPTVAALEK